MSFSLLVAAMLVSFGIGIPVVFALLIPSTLYLWLNNVPLFVIPQKMTNGVESFPLLAVPFFIAAGELMNTGGVTRRLVTLATTLVGHITGGLAHVVVVANIIMAGMSGSAIADAAGTGRVLVPAMVQAKYSTPFATAIVAASAMIGPIIPPSVPLVLFGFVASTSVGRLFLGGFIPGLMMGLFLMLTVLIISRRRHYPRYARATPSDFLAALGSAFWALLMPALIIGGILSGVFTPTEAAGVAAIYGLVIGMFVYREITPRDLLPIAVRVVRSTAVVFIIVSAAAVLQYIFARENVGAMLQEVFAPLLQHQTLALISINVIFLLLGAIMETATLLLLFVPLFLPLIDALGVDRVHFGVFMVLNLMIGGLTPPFGMVMFIMLNITGVTMKEFVREIWPMVLALIAVLLFITLYPPLVMFLPNLVMGTGK